MSDGRDERRIRGAKDVGTPEPNTASTEDAEAGSASAASTEEAGRTGTVGAQDADSDRTEESAVDSSAVSSDATDSSDASDSSEVADGSGPSGGSDPPVTIVVAPDGAEAGGVGGRARLALLGLAIVTLLALVAVTVLGWRSMEVRAEADARREATRTAERATEAILAYDHRHLDRDLQRASRYTTGKFAREYEKTSRNVLRKTAGDVEAVVEAEVMASSVVRASPDEVVCLLFVNQTTTSNVRQQSVPDRNRVRMTMTQVDGSWRVSNLDAL